MSLLPRPAAPRIPVGGWSIESPRADGRGAGLGRGLALGSLALVAAVLGR